MYDVIHNSFSFVTLFGGFVMLSWLPKQTGLIVKMVGTSFMSSGENSEIWDCLE